MTPGELTHAAFGLRRGLAGPEEGPELPRVSGPMATLHHATLLEVHGLGHAAAVDGQQPQAETG